MSKPAKPARSERKPSGAQRGEAERRSDGGASEVIEVGRYEVVIGLEVHTQLRTRSKLFSPAPVSYGLPPNHSVHPICLALPGVLPVLNRAAVELAIRAGLAMHGEVRRHSVFARKNYFYPDLPKGYQISQYEEPVIAGGWLDVALEAGGASTTRRVRLTRIHLEEDAGKSIHDPAVAGNATHVDLNRAGVPLLEIVSEPDLRSPAEAAAYLRALRSMLRYVEASDADLEHGHFRCDANVSLRPRGSERLGTRTELKNLNSFRAVEAALEAEIARQTELLDDGGKVTQATLAFDMDSRRIRVMRLKENADDYRYFPDPDLVPLVLSDAQIEAVRAALPELADSRCARYQREHGLSEYDARGLTASRALAGFFEAAAARHGEAKPVANWLLRDVLHALGEQEIEIEDAALTPEALADLVHCVESGQTTAASARGLVPELVREGGDPRVWIRERGLETVSDAGVLERAVDEVIARARGRRRAGSRRGGEGVELPDGSGDAADRRQGQPAARARAAGGADLRVVRWLVRGLAALLVLAVAGLGVLAWALPRLAKSDAAKARIQQIASRVLGRELRWSELDFGLLPPSLRVEAAELAGEAGGEPAARAQSVALRVELWPLLRRELQVSSLRVDGLVLQLVRTESGIALAGPAPKPQAPPAEPEPGAEPGAEPDAEPEESGIAFGIRRIALRDASFVVDDRTRQPVASWRIDDVDVEARGDNGDAPTAIEGALAALVGPDLDVKGPLKLEAELSDLTGAATGRFRIDASDAEIAYGAELKKPAGMRAELGGVLVRDDAGQLGVDDLELELRNLVARGELRSAPSTSLRLRADAFDLAGWEEVIRSLGVAPLTGKLAIPELSLTTEPQRVQGRIELDEVVASPAGRPPLALDGALALSGTALRSRELVLRAAGQPIALDASITDLFDAPRYEVSFETADADLDALLGAFAGQSGRIQGPLDAKGTLRGPLSGPKPFLDALSGELAFGVAQGKLVGVSLLESVLGPLGAQLAEAGRGQGGRDLQRFYGEVFELLSGSLRVEGGRILTRPIELRYRDYVAELQGPIALADLTLDLRGSLTYFESVDAELARVFGARDGYTPQRRTLEFVVRGAVSKPRVQLAGNSLAALGAAYAQAVGRDELRRQVERAARRGLRRGRRPGPAGSRGPVGGRRAAGREGDRRPTRRPSERARRGGSGVEVENLGWAMEDSRGQGDSGMPANVLYVDDDRNPCQIVAKALISEGDRGPYLRRRRRARPC